MNEIIEILDAEVEEAVSDKVGEFLRKRDGEKTFDKIRNSKKIHKKNLKVVNLSPEDYGEAKLIYNNIRSLNSYGMSEYRKYDGWIGKLCKILGIERKGLTIKNIIFNKNNSVTVDYHNVTKRIVVPNGKNLYHQSTVDGISSLSPTFMTKPPKKYLFGYPRVYFSMKAKMNKLGADLKPNEKTYTYIPKETLRDVFIDPLLSGGLSSFGAIYVETRYNIAVEQVDVNKLKEDKKKEEKEKDTKSKELMKKDEEGLNKTEDKVEESANEFPKKEMVASESSVRDVEKTEKVGASIRKALSYSNLKKNWKTLSDKFVKRKVKTIKLTNDEYDKLMEAFNACKKEDISVNEYQANYKKVCDIIKIGKKDSVIEFLEFKKNPLGYFCIFRYSEGNKIPIMLDNNSQLIHKSPLHNLSVLKPTFKSKLAGKYLTPTPRVYFTVSKTIDSTKMGTEGMKTYKYTPVEHIMKAYLDPVYSTFQDSAIYVETRFPIKVRRIE